VEAREHRPLVAAGLQTRASTPLTARKASTTTTIRTTVWRRRMAQIIAHAAPA
jgi:hypothetical protein